MPGKTFIPLKRSWAFKYSNALRTKSKRPLPVPPLIIIISETRAAFFIAAIMVCRSSLITEGDSDGKALLLFILHANRLRLLQYMHPVLMGDPGKSNSFPVSIIYTRGTLYTGTLSMPQAAILSRISAFKTCPLAATLSPAINSWPALRIFSPRRGLMLTII